MIATALELATPTLKDVAEWIGLTYGTVRAYRLGSRTPPRDAVLKLAKALRQQARDLVDMAERLEDSERKP